MHYVHCPVSAGAAYDNAGASGVEESQSSLAWTLSLGLQKSHSKPWPSSNVPPTALRDSCGPVGNATSYSGASQKELDLWLHRTFFCEAAPGQKGRTYVEMGATNGVLASNTLFFQQHLGWSGLLIEGHPVNAARLMHSKRANGRNVLVHEAVCVKPGTVLFSGPPNKGTAGVMSTMSPRYLKSWGKRFSAETARGQQDKDRRTANYTVPCRPMSQLLQLAGLGHVDLFVLDVEGAELLVLQTIDWSQVTVGVFAIEMDGYHKKRDAAIASFLEQHGYQRFNASHKKASMASLLISTCGLGRERTFAASAEFQSEIGPTSLQRPLSLSLQPSDAVSGELGCRMRDLLGNTLY